MVIASDLHIRRTPPRVRVDDYPAAQDRKMRFILGQAKDSPPLVIAGDLFHQAKPGPFLEQHVIGLLRDYDVCPIVVPGQHDLPGHSHEQFRDSGLGVLAAAGVIELPGDNELMHVDGCCIQCVWYGSKPIEHDFKGLHSRGVRTILLWHHMVINEPLWPGQVADKANAMLGKYPQFDVIITGDNHQSFVAAESLRHGRASTRWLVNPGSMMRMTAIQVDHKPCIYLYEGKGLQQVPIPIEEGVFDLTDLLSSKDKDERIHAFVERLDRQWESGLSFERNLESYFKANDTPERVRELVWGCLR